MKKNTEKILLVPAILGIILLFILMPGTAIADYAGEYQVLVLHSYHKWWNWTDGINQGIENTLKSAGVPYQLAVEYMDTKRVFNDEYVDDLKKLFRQRYKDTRFDIIISSDDNAFNFLLENRDNLFAGAPVVFCGVNNLDETLLKGVAGFTGVREELDLRKNIDLILDLHPNTKEIVVLLDPSPTGQRLTEEVKGIAGDYPQVFWRLLPNHTMQQVLDIAEGLEPGTVMLYVLFFRDANGVFFEHYQAGEMITQASKVPVYTPLDFYVGNGVVGGMVVSGYEQGQAAAGLALRVLEGEAAEKIPVVQKSPNRYMFDHRVMERFSLNIDDLPEGSEVINKPFSVYEEYRDQISIAIALFSLMVILLAVLLFIIVNRQRVQKVLAESEERFRSVFQTSPDPMMLMRLTDHTIVDVNNGFMEKTGYTADQVLGRIAPELGMWKDEQDRDHFYEVIRKDGLIDNLEVDLRTADGTIREALISARTVSIGGVPHLIILAKDVSPLKEAEGRLRVSLEEKEVLLKEIHHRVKNNLQVISGLLNLQAHHIEDEKSRELYKESQNRVITMALIHEELYQARDLAKVDFSTYIENLAENLLGSYTIKPDRVKLTMDVERQDIVVDTAIPCGLIINEIISNSLKHAFPDNRKGEISVKFKKIGDKSYQLSISDDGIGLPEGFVVATSSSLGMQLITVIVEQLGGLLEVKTGPGTSFTITFNEYLEADMMRL